MRHVKNTQLHFGEVNIADIEFDARSRDDIQANSTQLAWSNRKYISKNRNGFLSHVNILFYAFSSGHYLVSAAWFGTKPMIQATQ